MRKFQLTLASSYNITKIIFYFCCIPVFPFLLTKSDTDTQKLIWTGLSIVIFLIGTYAVLPTLRRFFYMLNEVPEDFIQVDQHNLTIPVNYVRPYKNKLSQDLLEIPMSTISKVLYFEQVARGQYLHLQIFYRLPNNEEKILVLYVLDFKNAQEDLDRLFDFFINKVQTEKLEFMR